MEQRSEEWFNQRLGRFTASQVSDLIGSFKCITEKQLERISELESEKKTGVNKNGNKVKWTENKDDELKDLKSKRDSKPEPDESFKTLAFKKACEIIFGRDPEWDVETWDMKRGTETEPEAFELFQTLKAKQFIKVEKAEFFPLGENSGASPDGLVGQDAVVEIKCPRPEKVFRIIKDGLSVLDKSWLDQVQLEMKCTNSSKAYFFIYCIWKGRPIYHELIIQRDEKHIDLILERIAEAVVLRDQYVEELRNKIQFEL